MEDTTKKEDDGVLDTLFRDSENEEEEYEDIYEPLVLSGEMFTKQLDLKTNACGVVKLENEIKGGAEAVKLNMNQENLSYKFLESEQYSDSNMCFSLLQVSVFFWVICIVHTRNCISFPIHLLDEVAAEIQTIKIWISN